MNINTTINFCKGLLGVELVNVRQTIDDLKLKDKTTLIAPAIEELVNRFNRKELSEREALILAGYILARIDDI